MSTGSSFIEVTHNRLLELADVKERFFDYLQNSDVEMLGRVYDDSGVFMPGLSLDITVVDQFSINGSALATDGSGHIFNTSDTLAAYCQAVKFENSIGVTYDVALHHVYGPMISSTIDTVRANSRTTQPEYIGRMEFIGEQGEPDSISIVGPDITFTIDTICEAGVSHAGRKALVYLRTPYGTTNAVALPIVDVVWTGGANKVTVLATLLGQGTASGTAGDYQIILLGPTVRRNTSLENKEDYTFIGAVTGGGAGNLPSDQSIDDQKLIKASLSDLNNAFETFAQPKGIEAGEAGRKAAKTTDVWNAASAVHNKLIYTFGGSTDDAGTVPANKNEVYDPATNTWASKLAVPDTFTIHMSAATIGDYIYVVGGQSNLAYSVLCRRYDVAGNTWSNVAPLSQARAGGKLVALNGKLFYVGGDGGTWGTVNPQITVYRFDPDVLPDGEWTGVEDLPVGADKVYHTAEVHNGKIYVIGGGYGVGTNFISPETYAYDAVGDSWATLSSFDEFEHDEPGISLQNAPGAWSASAVHNDVIHLVCGRGNQGGVLSAHLVYDPSSDSWVRFSRPETPYIYGTAFGHVDGVLYMFGGLRHKEDVDPTLSQKAAYAVNLNGVFRSEAAGSVTDIGTIAVNSGGGITTLVTGMYSDRVGAGTCKIGSGILIAGGTDGAGATFKSCELHFPQTGLRCTVADMPGPRCFHGVVNRPYGDNGETDQVVVIGGASNVALTAEISTWQWDPGQNIWTVIASLGAVDRMQFGRPAVIDGIAYCVGGTTGGAVNDIVAYDLNTHNYLGAVGTLPVADVRGAAVFARGKNIWILGGDTAGAATDTIMVFNTDKIGWVGLPAIAAILQGATLPSAERMLDGEEWNGRFYFAGGDSGELFEFQPGSNETKTIQAGVATRFFPAVHIIHGQAYMFGGADAVNGFGGNSDIFEIKMDARAVNETPLAPSNYSTRKQADSVGFKAGQIYGSHSWDANTVSDMTRMIAEV